MKVPSDIFRDNNRPTDVVQELFSAGCLTACVHVTEGMIRTACRNTE